jgi:uncharacterized protein YndB with AHSA1/START domain
MSVDTTSEAIAAIVKIITLNHPVERVWRAITDPAEVAAWFPTRTAEWELRPGSWGRLVWTAESTGGAADDPDYESTVRIERVEPPTTFAYTWDHQNEPEPARLVEFTLRDLGSERTELTLRESGFVRPAQREGNDSGWDAELGELTTYLDNDRP